MPHSGHHVCAIYSTTDELVSVAIDFLREGLQRGERCWYLPNAAEDAEAVGRELKNRSVDRPARSQRDAVTIVGTDAAYAIRGAFDPEQTMRVFADAIEQALTDGFSGFRAAAEMSWVLGCPDGAEGLITYEALLRSLFSTEPATGLCLYHRDRMPLQVIDGALSTHPLVRALNTSSYIINPFYDQNVASLPTSDDAHVRRRLAELDALVARDGLSDPRGARTPA